MKGKSMYLFTRMAATVGLLALAMAGSVSTVREVSAAPKVVGHVYVNDNTSGKNTISAFDQLSNGTLSPMHGSPFTAGGAGTGTIIGSQGALQVTDDGHYLLAVAAGSNQISVLRVDHDGELHSVGSPVGSGGIEPVSIAVHEDLVYVANEGNGTTGSNYTGFKLNKNGRLTPLRNSTVPLPPTALPGDVFFNSDGTHLVGTEVGTTDPSTFLIDSFVVGKDGRLTAAPGSPFPAQGAGPFGSQFRPTNPTQLYVSNAHNGPSNGTVSAFRVAKNGVLTSIGASPYPDNQTAPCWIEITHDGKYLFTVNTGSSSISRYRIHSNGTLTLLGSTPFKNPTGLRPFDARLAPNGKYLYVVDAGLDAVSVFAVHGGTLTELAASPVALPAGATPFGIVVTGNGEHDD
jgi:6-phosphogluconolactonase (cycloisomerase 2 family)